MEKSAARSRTRSRGGRANKRSLDMVKSPHLHVPFIERGIPAYDILGEEGLEKIDATAERIMAEIGLEFRDDPETVRIFEAAGAKATHVSGENWNVKFEPGMIKEILKTAPARFTQHARNPKNNVDIGGTAMCLAPSYGSPFVMDLDHGRRYGTIKDFENFVKLAQSSPWLHHSGGTICEPTDIPVNKRHLDMVYAHMKYSDRAFLGSITAPERAADSIEMARILFGEDYVANNCVIMGNFNSTSPLVWDGVTTKGIREYAQAGQGSIHLPFLLGGAVSPVTAAGSLAQMLAETLTGCALTQLVNPGAPTVMASFQVTLDLRSGSPTFGTPEAALGTLGACQLARKYNLPIRAGGNFVNSKLPDAQAMQQGMMSMMSALQGGANYILHSAGFLDGLLSMSYEKFMMDLNICGAAHAYLKGFGTSEDDLAFDALAEYGPGEHMFGGAHTLRHYETAYWDSELDDYQPWETWDEQGGIDNATRANQAWKKSLETYKAPPLDIAKDEELRAYMAQKKASMEDAWY
ncbi:MAG: trimethylamine methyltransferase family protein [Halocynthiibacter sp.]